MPPLTRKQRRTLVGLGCVLVVVLAAGGWLLRGGITADDSSATPGQFADAGKHPAPATGASPDARSYQAGATTAIPKPGSQPISRALSLLRQSNDWKSAYAALESGATGAPDQERLFYQAVVLDTCSMYAFAAEQQSKRLSEALLSGTWENIKAFVQSTIADPRQKHAMQFALERNIANVCAGFADTRITQQQIEDAYRAAAAAGNPAAQARMIERRMVDSSIANADSVPAEFRRMQEPTGVVVGFPDPLSDAEKTQLFAALASRDPLAILEAGPILSYGTDGRSLRIGAEQIDIGDHSQEVWNYVACMYGFECGSQNMYVNAACAELRQCSDDYASYLREFVLNRDDFERVQSAARLIAEAIDRGEWTAFRFVDTHGSNISLLQDPRRIRVR